MCQGRLGQVASKGWQNHGVLLSCWVCGDTGIGPGQVKLNGG